MRCHIISSHRLKYAVPCRKPPDDATPCKNPLSPGRRSNRSISSERILQTIKLKLKRPLANATAVLSILIHRSVDRGTGVAAGRLSTRKRTMTSHNLISNTKNTSLWSAAHNTYLCSRRLCIVCSVSLSLSFVCCGKFRVKIFNRWTEINYCKRWT